MKIEAEVEIFIDKAIPLLHTPETIGSPCPQCGTHVRFPVVVRRSDVEAFEQLLSIAGKYLKDKGGTEAMLKDIMEKIKDRLNIQ